MITNNIFGNASSVNTGPEIRKQDDKLESKSSGASASTGAIPKSISFDTAQNHSSISTKGSRDKSFFPK